MSSAQPNIVYIMSDQHNADIISAMGDSNILTPNLDKLYMAGTSFDAGYCNSPLCVPSRSSMLSGQYPVRTGVQNNMQCLSSSTPTFVHSLGAAGYETVLSGRMHFVSWDQRHGFEKRFVGDITPTHAGSDNQEKQYGELMRGSDQSHLSIERSGAGSSAVLEFDRSVFSEAEDYLENRSDDRPLFLLVGTYGPHCPYVSPPDLFDYYYNLLDDLELPEGYKDNIHPAIQGWYENRGVENVAAEDVRRIRAAYYGMVTYLDQQIGHFMQVLENTMDMENTIVIYGSDHGDNIGEHGLFWKTNFYEGASRIPLAIRWDNHIAGGIRIKEPVSLVDIAPTLIDFAKADQLPHFDGRSLYPSLVENKSLDSKDVLAFCSDIKGDKPSVMVRRDQYKMVVHAGYDTPQLFDLSRDPKEYDDLGAKSEYKELIASMKESLKGLWDEQQSIDDLQKAKAEVNLMKDWFKMTSPEAVDEWYGTLDENRIIYKKPEEKASLGLRS